MKLNILMVGEDRKIKGGIASVVNAYFNSDLIKEQNIIYLPTYTGKNIFAVFFKALCIFFYYLFFQKIDIVHINSASRGSFYRKSIFVLISCFFRKKIIFHIHCGRFYNFYKESSILLKFFIQRILCSATVVIVVSELLKKYVKKIIDTPKKLNLVLNPVKFPQFNRKGKIFSNLGNIKILFMGKLIKEKGIYDLIEIAERLIPQEKKIEFILCGNGEIKKVKVIVEKKAIEQYFNIPGCVTDKEKYFKEADIFVLPSYYEGVPISILEAATYNLPIVATSVGGIPEVIEDGINGFLVNPGDIEEFKNKILKLIHSVSLRNKMGKIAYYWVKNKFNVNIITKQLNTIYQGLFDK